MSAEQPLIPAGWLTLNHPIEKELKQSYIDYAMSVIVMRALPDTRDWFKPVLRRILYAMHDMKLWHTAKYKKSAAVVGEVLGKYHPHGDQSVYDAMVRLAQPFSMRYPLVDGQGNFGSVDWDGAAAMRYTEARLTKIAEEMLTDIDQDTVDRRDNYDSSIQEPITLPTKFPNHLCNGTMGIAVGMATNMAPHNLTEVLDACLMLIKKPEATVDDIMEIIQGPDFPTGGTIYDPENIREVYRRGKWWIVMRGKTHFEEKKWAPCIVIDELPYMVNKSNLVAKIGDLVVTKKLEWITDITDESKNDIRVVIQLKKWLEPERILYMLYKMTDLQCNFNLNNVTLVENGLQPRMLNIKDLLVEYVEYRRLVVLRRSAFQLDKAKARLHILEGLKKAIDILDEVIDTIRKSQTKDEAKKSLITKFEFSEIQAEYILQMRLQSLVWLEIEKIINEIDEKKALIEYLEGILSDTAKRDEVVVEEMKEVKKKFGDERRTEVSTDTSVYALGKSLKAMRDALDRREEDVIVLIENDRRVKVLYQSRIVQTPEETLEMIYTNNQDRIAVITDQWELVVERLKDLWSHKISGNPFDFKKEYKLKGEVIFAKTLLHSDYEYLCFLTNHNSLKKIKKELLLKFKKFPTTCMNLPGKGERIVSVLPTDIGDNLAVVTKNGRWLIFPEDWVRAMWKTAWGVRAIELQPGDAASGMFIYQDEPFLMIYAKTEAKLLNIEDLRIRKRARKWDERCVLEKKQSILWGMSVVEWNVRLRLEDGTIETHDCNNIYLGDPDAGLDKLTKKPIEVAYRPWEEQEESLKKREEIKKKLREERAKLQEQQWIAAAEEVVWTTEGESSTGDIDETKENTSEAA